MARWHNKLFNEAAALLLAATALQLADGALHDIAIEAGHAADHLTCTLSGRGLAFDWRFRQLDRLKAGATVQRHEKIFAFRFKS